MALSGVFYMIFNKLSIIVHIILNNLFSGKSRTTLAVSCELEPPKALSSSSSSCTNHSISQYSDNVYCFSRTVSKSYYTATYKAEIGSKDEQQKKTTLYSILSLISACSKKGGRLRPDASSHVNSRDSNSLHHYPRRTKGPLCT